MIHTGTKSVLPSVAVTETPLADVVAAPRALLKSQKERRKEIKSSKDLCGLTDALPHTACPQKRSPQVYPLEMRQQ